MTIDVCSECGKLPPFHADGCSAAMIVEVGDGLAREKKPIERDVDALNAKAVEVVLRAPMIPSDWSAESKPSEAMARRAEWWGRWKRAR